MEAHDASFELASYVTTLKVSLTEKEKVLENFRTSMTISEMDKETLTYRVVEVKGALKEEKEMLKEENENVKACNDNLAVVMKEFKDSIEVASKLLFKPYKTFPTRWGCCTSGIPLVQDSMDPNKEVVDWKIVVIEEISLLFLS